MIVCSGIITIDPAKAPLMTELTAGLMIATQAEDGNLTYEYSHSPSDPGRWRVFEEWESDDAITAHMATAHMAEFIGRMGDVGVTGASIDKYEVSAKSKLM